MEWPTFGPPKQLKSEFGPHHGRNFEMGMQLAGDPPPLMFTREVASQHRHGHSLLRIREHCQPMQKDSRRQPAKDWCLLSSYSGRRKSLGWRSNFAWKQADLAVQPRGHRCSEWMCSEKLVASSGGRAQEDMHLQQTTR